MGPGWCVSCRLEEDLNHILLHYVFSQTISKEAYDWYGLPFNWNYENIKSCLTDWYKSLIQFQEILGFVCWELWKLLNEVIF